MNVRFQRGVMALALAVLLAGCSDGGKPGTVGKDLKAVGGLHVAVIPKGTTHEFWMSIHAGAIKAQKEYEAQGVSVRLTWKGPIREDDREQQIQVVEGFLSQGVNGIVLAPLDASALVRPVQEAKGAGIPTVVIDSALASGDAVSFVATDNEKGGSLAADRLGMLLGGKGRVLLLRYQEGSASTEAREKGFLDRMKAQYPAVQIVSADQFAGPTRDTAKRASENLLNRFGNQVEGIFTPNESSTAGMLLALQDVGKAGQIKFVGFDSSEAFITAMRNKQLDGVVLQNPFEMGYQGVKTMVAHLKGQAIQARVDTGVTIVTPDNLDTEASKALLNPPLSEYLK
ncbi:D-allose-binding periplasmic protein precursor [Luteitalea pratensis]|uniref:D-allose-binding periplasmic protein n=1 Tax=Luteitalea pratensis TaxID=1855912 RepID=A0A143PTH5_LUTPR|nr:substrate-binding domain-containing protein [Luteitalea pratensis]AMY11390.1 D-allose-binding periplasmic protein precursor [Luteitalea pratensis]